MRPLHSKKKLSTRADAHRFRQAGVGGGMAVSDYLSEAERQQIAEDVVSQLEEVTRAHFPRTQNLEYAILKSHLIVEFAITEFIRCTSFSLVAPEHFRFTFSQKLEIAVLNGLGLGDPTTVPSIEILNQIRNQVGHRFSFDRQLLLELIAINSEDSGAAKLTDRQCITFLRNFCSFLCGRIAGHINTLVVVSERA